MKIKPIASNMTELYLNNGIVVLFSYETPVAYYHELTNRFVKTTRFYSKTTTRHINKWFTLLDRKGFGATSAIPVDQAVLDELVKG